MRNLLSITLCVTYLVFASPVFSLDKDGNGDFLIFRNGATRTNECARTKLGYVKDPDIMVEWEPDHIHPTDWYQRQGDQVILVLPEQNPHSDNETFQALCSKDGDVPGQLLPYLSILANLNDEDKKTTWIKIKSITDLKLSTEAISAIETHAAECNVVIK